MIVEAIMLGMLTSACYDTMKMSGTFMKDKFIAHLNEQNKISRSDVELIAIELEKLNLNDDMSEKAIKEKINSSETLVNIINNSKSITNNITQNNVNGDNVAGNKIINER